MFDTIDLSNLTTKDGFAGGLKLDVFVVCGSLGSLIDIKVLIETLYDDNIALVPDKDATIVCEVNTLTDECDSKVIIPTEKKNVTKILRKEFPLPSNTIRIRYNPHSKKTKETKKKGDNTFYNCATIEFIKDTSNISCKVFPNGKLHIAGCRTAETANRVINEIKDFIMKYAPDCIRNKDYYELTNFRIVMIKTSFKFRAIFDLETTRNVLANGSFRQGSWRVAGYEPNKFSGLKIEHISDNDKATILIFRTGSATIAAKTVAQLNDAYVAITTLLRHHRSQISEDPSDPLPTTRKAVLEWENTISGISNLHIRT